MKTTLKMALLVSASAFALAACGGGSSNSPTPSNPTALENNFGATFGTLFRAAANSDATDPGPNSVIPVSLTTDPIPVP